MPMLSNLIPLSRPRPPPHFHVSPGCDFKETSVYACVGVIFSGVQIWDEVSPLNLWFTLECFGKVLLYHGRVEMEKFGGREWALRCTYFDDDDVCIGKMHLLVRCWRRLDDLSDKFSRSALHACCTSCSVSHDSFLKFGVWMDDLVMVVVSFS